MSSSRAEVNNVTLPNKPSSEIPAKTSRTHWHQHHHLHRRDKDVKSPQPRSSDQHESVACIESRSVSRQTSILGSADGSSWMVGWPPQRREAKTETEKSAMRIAYVHPSQEGKTRADLHRELRRSFLSLNTVYNDTARRLDTAYYSVHEKLDVLHNTIASLKDLAQRTGQLNNDFNLESRGIVIDIEAQLKSFENFCGQEKNIKELQKRIEAGRESVQALGARVEVVKRKVEGWEKVEIEWQQRTRKRLKILWSFIGLALLAFILFLVFQYTPARTQTPDVPHDTDIKRFTLSLSSSEENLDNGTLLGDDARLKGFDEL